MKKTARGMLRTLATRGVIAVIPVAMVGAYAGNLLVPTPPRIAAFDYQQVAEITVSPNTVGVAASPLYGQTKAQIDAQLDEMQALGVENIRVFVPWGSIDFFGPSQPGSLSWATLDLVMQSAKEHDMGVMAEINSTPPSAAANGTGSIFGTDTPDPAKFAAFMTKFVGAYGDEVSAYEIWNEPNSIQFSNPIDPVAYAALVKAAYQAIKPLDPTATVVAGAVGHVFTTGVTMDPVEFVQAMIAADPTIANYFDALSYHPYDETLPFSAGNVDPNSGGFASDTAYNQIKDLMALFPTKKVWLTEFGVPTYSYTQVNPFTGLTETITVTQAQQEALISNLINNWGTLFPSQAGPVFLYTGRDTATGSPIPDNNFGLWTSTGAEKSVIYDYLRAWYAAHPQNPSGPTDPPPATDPGAALAAAFQVLAQQIAQAISQAFAQAFVQQLGQQIATAIVNAIANALASLGQPQPVATTTPLTLRVASVEAPTVSSLAAEPTGAADTSGTVGDATVAVAKTAAATDSTPPVAAAADPVVEAAAPAAKPAATTPEVTEPVATTTPATTTPAATTPAATTTPEPTSTPTSTPAATTPATDAGTPAASKGDGEQASAPKAGDPDKQGSTKTGDDKSASAKPAKDGSTGAEKPGPRKSDPPAGHSKGKGGNAVAAAEPKVKPEPAAVASTPASASTSEGSASAG